MNERHFTSYLDSWSITLNEASPAFVELSTISIEWYVKIFFIFNVVS